MKERGILFSAPMVRALLSGTKTQTRRVIKPQQPKPSRSEPYEWELTERDGQITCYTTEQLVAAKCRYGAPGDRLWVRETHCAFHVGEGMDRAVPECVAYRATTVDDSFDYVNTRGEILGLTVTKWTPAIHMPRWASRLTLAVTAVRVERLQDISEADAKAEGVDRDTEPCDHTRLCCEEIGCMGPTYRSTYAALWQEINGAESWEANPLVWVVEFKRVDAVARAA